MVIFRLFSLLQTRKLQKKLDRVKMLIQRGQTSEARTICLEVLRSDSEHAEVLALLEIVAAATEDKCEAIDCYSGILERKPENARAHYKRANLLRDTGRMDDALVGFDRAINLDPGYGNAHCNRGAVLAHLGRWDSALDGYNRAIACNPSDALAFYNRGAALRALGRPQDAVSSYDQAIAIDPGYAEALCNRGILFAELGRLKEALADYDKCLDVRPAFAAGYLNRGALLHRRRDFAASLTDFERAIALNPSYAEAHCYRGSVLGELRQWSAALSSFDQAIRLNPEYADVYCSRASLLVEVADYDAALVDFARAIVLIPNHADAHFNRANLLFRRKRYADAILDYGRAMSISPDYRFAAGSRFHAKMSICDWNDFASDVERLVVDIAQGRAVSPPFPLLSLMDSPSLHRLAAEIWVREECATEGDDSPKLNGSTGGKVRLGYFSADFHDHPVAGLMAELFESHDRARFEITAFSFGPNRRDDTRLRLERAFDEFVDVCGMSDREIAMLARQHGIDIAVDLGGYTASSRPRIFAWRAAPVQVAYLGYPATTGAGYVDYLVGDSVVIPKKNEEFYAEKIAYLPHSYLSYDSTRKIATAVRSREHYGLPANSFVFCCFNNNYKITPLLFDIWMRLLARVEGSVLWLSESNPTAVFNLRAEALRRGVDEKRMVFAGRMQSLPEHLARHRAADLFLDTLPYNAHATAMDALWAGLPVLTCVGDAFAGRVAASLLTALDLGELIAATMEEYLELAVHLATDATLLKEIRDKLAENRHKAPLFDTRRATADLEAVFTTMYERHAAGLSPEHIYAARPGNS